MIDTFDQLAEEIGGKADAFVEDVWGHVERIAGILNGAADSVANNVGGFLDAVTPDAVFFDFDMVEDAIRKWNNEIFPTICSEMEKLATELDKALDTLVGDPLALIDYSNEFASAGSDLYQAQTLGQRLLSLGGAWSGDAYDAYVVVAGEQNDAYQALAEALEEGSTLTNEAAQSILTLWRQLANEFATTYVDALEILSDATSVEKVISFEVPTIISAVAKIVAKVIAIADLLLEFMINQGTNAAHGWTKANNGSPGLPQNVWPIVLESSSDPINDPNLWDVKV